MKICLRLLIFELSDCTLRICRGYDFSSFLILLFLDRYFEVFDSDLRASLPPYCLVMECPLPPWDYSKKERECETQVRQSNCLHNGNLLPRNIGPSEISILYSDNLHVLKD